MKKKVEKKVNPYTAYNTHDASLLNKLDEKIEYFGKQNKKYATEFYYNAKQFFLNAIEIKKNNSNEENKLPKTLLNIINDRDIDKLFQRYQNDTRTVAKELFTEEMTIEEIVAVAIEYVRLSSSNFERYDSERPQSDLSATAQKFARSYNGVLSFYFGLADDVDRAQLMTRLINLGIDVKHSIAYAECIVDAYGIPITQIIEFKGKPVIAISAYCGAIKSYSKNIASMSSMYQFMDFSECVPKAKTRALKVFKKFNKCKDVLPTVPSLEQACEKLAVSSFESMSPLTVSQANMLVNVNNKIVKFATLCEILCLDRNIEYELIPDLFLPHIATIKVLSDNGRFKIFPNKVLNEEMELADKHSFILNKGAETTKETSSNSDSFSDSLDSINRDAQAEFGSGFANANDVEPLPASQVLESLQVHFKPKEVNDFLLDGARFNITESQLKKSMSVDLSDLGELHSVDFDKAEQERLELEKELGVTPVEETTNNKKKKKSFYDMLDEIEEKVQNSKAKKLQERFEQYQQNGDLNVDNNVDNTSNLNNDAIQHKNDNITSKNDNNPTKNDNVIDNTLEQTSKNKVEIDNKENVENESNDKEKVFNFLESFDGVDDDIDYNLAGQEWEEKYSVGFDNEENIDKFKTTDLDSQNITRDINLEKVNKENEKKLAEAEKEFLKEKEKLLLENEKLKRENEKLKDTSKQLKDENKKIKATNKQMLKQQEKMKKEKENEKTERVNINHYHDASPNLSASALKANGTSNKNITTVCQPESDKPIDEEQLQESFLPNINKVPQQEVSDEKSQKPSKGQSPLKASNFAPQLPRRNKMNVPKLPKRKA